MDRRVLGLSARAASSSCRSTIARRRSSWRASRGIVAARLILIGQDVPPTALRRGSATRACRSGSCTSWIGTTRRAASRRCPRSPSRATTSPRSSSPPAPPPNPKGVVITHRNVLANIVPVEREVLKYRKWGTPFFPLAVPEPAAAQPHVRPGDGDLHPADAAGHGRLHARLQPDRNRRADQEAARVGARVGAEDPRRAAGSRRCAWRPSRRCPGRSSTVARRWWRYRKIHRAVRPEVLVRSSSAPRRSTPRSKRSGASSASS